MNVVINLDGYETAIYEIYPLSEAKEPLVAGAFFDIAGNGQNRSEIILYPADKPPVLLNPGIVKTSGFKPASFVHPLEGASSAERTLILSKERFTLKKDTGALILTAKLSLNASLIHAVIAILLTPEKGFDTVQFPHVSISQDDVELKALVNKENGHWCWISAGLLKGTGVIRIMLMNHKGNLSWREKPLSTWFVRIN